MPKSGREQLTFNVLRIPEDFGFQIVLTAYVEEPEPAATSKLDAADIPTVRRCPHDLVVSKSLGQVFRLRRTRDGCHLCVQKAGSESFDCSTHGIDRGGLPELFEKLGERMSLRQN